MQDRWSEYDRGPFPNSKLLTFSLAHCTYVAICVDGKKDLYLTGCGRSAFRAFFLLPIPKKVSRPPTTERKSFSSCP